MPVFKLSMKIIKKNIPIMSIYIVIFLTITALFANQGSEQNETLYKESHINVAWISHEESLLVDGFKDMLSQYANYVDVEDNREVLQDALFFRVVEYIIRIPEGFTESIMKGEPKDVEITSINGSVTSAYINMTIEQYLNTAKLYIIANPEIAQEELVDKLNNSLSYKTPIVFQDNEVAKSSHEFAKYYFNFYAYSAFAMLVLGISSVILAMNNKDIKRRNTCSPMTSFRMNMEYLVGHLIFTVIIWIVMTLFYFVFDFKNSIHTHTLVFMLNSFVFILCASAISYFLGGLVKNQNTLAVISNVVTLGPSFISGVFVPQEFLGEGVLKIASFTPTYWYAKANSLISELSSFDFNSLKPVYSSILIQVGFAAAFLMLSLVVNKKRQLEA